MILGRRADHRRSADVDLLDEVVELDAVPFGRRRERIQVDDHEFERGDRSHDERFAMGDQTLVGEDPGVDPRMQGLHPPTEHLGKPGHSRDIRGW